MVPATGVVALLVNPSSATTQVETKELNEAAHVLGVEIRIMNAASESEIDAAFAALAKERSVLLVVSADNLFTVLLRFRPRIGARRREFVEAAGSRALI